MSWIVPDVTVIGGGMAGSECAWQLAERGLRVALVEMKPATMSPAHQSPLLGELVCSNSLRSDEASTPAGLLKRELRAAGSMVIACAELARVPAGSALAVERLGFARAITTRLAMHPNIRLERRLAEYLPDGQVVVATGPLTAGALGRVIRRELGGDRMYFYDAIAPIVSADSIDMERAFKASRWDGGTRPPRGRLGRRGRAARRAAEAEAQLLAVPPPLAEPGDDSAAGGDVGVGDYINCPLTRDEYYAFVEAIREGRKVLPHEFEEPRYFESCMPVEVMAERGVETLRFGPMKPLGLDDPRTGRWPFAVVQLRPENKHLTSYNMVGFQTRLAYPEQQRIFAMVPALASAEFTRFGSIHRNTYIDAPAKLGMSLELRSSPRIHIAGLLTGVEGYIESIATGLLVARLIADERAGLTRSPPPPTTMIGALHAYITAPREGKYRYSPTNVNYGLLPPLDGFAIDGGAAARRDNRKPRMAARAIADFDAWISERPSGIQPAMRADQSQLTLVLGELVDAVKAAQPIDAALVARVMDFAPELVARAVLPTNGDPYSRLHLDEIHGAEIMIAGWRPKARCAPHDHGGSRGVVLPLSGEFVEERFAWRADGQLTLGSTARRPTGIPFNIDGHLIHAMGPLGGGVTLHVYAPEPTRMGVYDLPRGEFIDVHGDVGAWIPPSGTHPRLALSDAKNSGLAQGSANQIGGERPVVWVGYTTMYRGGSAEFAVVAKTLVRELAAAHPEAEVVLAPLERKVDFVTSMSRLREAGRRITELHFVGHSGMYGIMFGSIAWPEQLSPHEWRTLADTDGIPFAAGANAYFHACRTGRWFTPFFARTFGVTAHGHHGYTTISTRRDKFAWAGRTPTAHSSLYLIATIGKKTHGLLGSVRKYRGAQADPMQASVPTPPEGTTSYDQVADLYDRAYVDIRVRGPEWAWVVSHARQVKAELGRGLRILEVGCGNGALLRALDDEGLLESAVGLDDSDAMVARARARSGERRRLRFAKITGPTIDLGDDSVDVVLSFLSFRYLDWDPLMVEVRRVLSPGGRMWMVDMVEQPVRLRELPLLARGVVEHVMMPRRYPQFAADLAALTSHPDWKTMVKYNPIRAEHEYRWYFESRFPGRLLEILGVTPRQRMVAFDTGPLVKGHTVPLSYP